MLFAHIIREAGGSHKNFPNASKILITLYDEKDRVDSDETVYFMEPLFARNRREQSRFFNYLKTLESSPVSEMNVRIDAASVILHYKSPKAKVFRRN